MQTKSKILPVKILPLITWEGALPTSLDDVIVSAGYTLYADTGNFSALSLSLEKASALIFTLTTGVFSTII
jgi:hypothetical protein